MSAKKILITGAAGYIGRLLSERLRHDYELLGTDIRVPDDATIPMVRLDIRDRALERLLVEEGITHIVHLASVIESGKDRARDFDIDVNGTRNVLESARKAGVKHVTISSSGAAYGYHADNPDWLDEADPVRGHDAFSYSAHKREVEELLARYRRDYPELKQLIFRPGTVLGATTDNLITNLFSKKRVLAVQGSDSPFVFIWDEDVVGAIAHGLDHDSEGIYNLAGDGALTIREIASMLAKPTLELPPTLLRVGLGIGRALGVGRYGPEQLDFLRYRPVLSNRRLKEELGYLPQKTSAETFAFYIEHARARGAI